VIHAVMGYLVASDFFSFYFLIIPLIFGVFFIFLRSLKLYFFKQIDVKTSHFGEINDHGFVFDRVIVMGGSISGLLAAGALSRHSKEVIIIEKKSLDSSTTGSIVPQGEHFHVLMARGAEIWEKLCPNITNAMHKRSNGSICDWGSDLKWKSSGGWRVPMDPGEIGIETYQLTRSALEELLRIEILKMENIKLIDLASVTGLITSVTGPNNEIVIEGVRYIRKVSSNGNSTVENVPIAGDTQISPRESLLASDLVVDCSGLTTQTPKWFLEMGYPMRQKKVNCYLGYSGLILSPPADKHSFNHIYCQTIPPTNTRALGMMPVEDGRWMFTVGGINKDYPPRDLEGFADFIKDLDVPSGLEILRKSTPVTEVKSYRVEGNRYNFFEDLNIDGFIAIGDSVATFNPVYGQGMTTASEGVLLMDYLLRKKDFCRKSFCRIFQRQLSHQLILPWLFASATDLRYPKTSGGTLLDKIISFFVELLVGRIFFLGSKHKYVHKQTMKIINMVYGYADVLIDPKLYWYVLFG